MTKRDSKGQLPAFQPGDRVLVLPLNMEATVIEQLCSYDCADEWFWGNVKLLYADGITGTSNSWQLQKL